MPGFCKSAGTLVALAADELVISDLGELGPLDVQRLKKDHLWEMESGLTVSSALSALQERAWLAFEDYFMRLEGSSGGVITLQTAAEIAATLTTRLFAPVYQQIDPKQVGESAREMQIAKEYGERLISKSDCAKAGALERLLGDYPTHGFVIDRTEAQELFKDVRSPSREEQALEARLGSMAKEPVKAAPVGFLCDELPEEASRIEEGGNGTQATDGVQNGKQGDSADRSTQAASGGNEAGLSAPGARRRYPRSPVGVPNR